MNESENAIWALAEQLEIMNISKKKSVSKNEHTEEVKGLIEAVEYMVKCLEHGDDQFVVLNKLVFDKTIKALKPFEKEGEK